MGNLFLKLENTSVEIFSNFSVSRSTRRIEAQSFSSHSQRILWLLSESTEVRNKNQQKEKLIFWFFPFVYFQSSYSRSLGFDSKLKFSILKTIFTKVQVLKLRRNSVTSLKFDCQTSDSRKVRFS